MEKPLIIILYTLLILNPINPTSSTRVVQSQSNSIFHFITSIPNNLIPNQDQYFKNYSIGDYNTKIIQNLSFNYGVVTIEDNLSRLRKIQINFLIANPFVNVLREAWEFEFKNPNQTFSLKLRDIRKFANFPFSKSQSQVFVFNAINFEQVLSVIRNSGYKHEEDVVFIVSVPLQEQFEFFASAEKYGDKSINNFQSTLIIEFITRLDDEEYIYHLKWYYYCHLCPIQERIRPGGILSSTNSYILSLSQNTLSHIKREINWNGHGTFGAFFDIGDTTLEKFEKCLAEPYSPTPTNSGDYDYKACNEMHMILHIVATTLNITVKKIHYLNSNVRGLKIRPALVLDENLFFGSKIFTAFGLTFIISYCENAVDFIEPSWDFLLKPFDKYIWIGIICTVLGFSLIHDGNVRYGLDIIWTLILQPMQVLQRNRWASSLIVVLIVICHAYLGVISSSVIAPLPKKTIKSIKELTTQGYRIVANNPDTIPYFSKVLSQFLTPHNITPDEFCCVIENSTEYEFPYSSDQFMVQNKGLVFRVKDPEMDGLGVIGGTIKSVSQDSIGGHSVSDSDVVCHHVSQPLKEDKQMMFSMSSYLSTRAWYLFNQVGEIGLTRFWYKRSLERRITQELMKRKTYQEVKVHKLRLDSHTKILFYLYLIGLGLSSCTYIFEYIYWKLKIVFRSCNKNSIELNYGT